MPRLHRLKSSVEITDDLCLSVKALDKNSNSKSTKWVKSEAFRTREEALTNKERFADYVRKHGNANKFQIFPNSPVPEEATPLQFHYFYTTTQSFYPNIVFHIN